MSTNPGEIPVLRFVNEVVNARQYDVLNEIIADDFEFHGPTTSLKGCEDFRRFVKAFQEAWNISLMQVASLKSTSKLVTVKVVLAGQHAGEIWGIPPTGKDVSLTATLTMRVRGGKIVTMDVAYDTNTMLRQLGVLSK